MRINKFQTKEEAAAAAGEELNNILTENRNFPVLLLLSGGSSFDMLDYVDAGGFSEKLTITVADERYSTDPKINNFLQLQKTDFYARAFEHEVNFIGTLPRPNESMGDLAKRWQNNLENWEKENQNGKIIATLGMGADGHTAGIFPTDDKKAFENLFEDKNSVISYRATAKTQFPERIAATITFLKKISIAVCFACGTEKKEKLDKAILNKGKLNELPALVWNEIKDTRIFTDITEHGSTD